MAARSAKAPTSVVTEPRPATRPARRQVDVGDYTRLTAAAAVEAARAIGLRPAPERVEVKTPETYGLVVAHDPNAGATTTRGTMLTLYVGAPATQLEPEASDITQRPAHAAAPVDAATDLGALADVGSETALGLGEQEPARGASTERLVV